MSKYDEALILSSLEYQNNPLYQCGYKEKELKKKYISDSQAEKKISHMLLAHATRNNCNSQSHKPIHFVGDYGFNSCLCNFKHPIIDYYTILSEQFDIGVMPHDGCLSDQSARLIDIIYLIKMLKSEHLLKLQEKKGK